MNKESRVRRSNHEPHRGGPTPKRGHGQSETPCSAQQSWLTRSVRRADRPLGREL